MPVSRSKRRPRKTPPGVTPAVTAEPERAALRTGWLAEGAGRPTAAILLLLIAPLAIGVSQVLPHTASFGELGFLFTFSAHDVALALLGLGVLAGGLATNRQFAVVIAVFCAALILSLFNFIGLWQVFLAHGIDEQIYLVTPGAVGLTGLALWLPQRFHYAAALVVAVCLAFDIALFIGLQDLAHNINTFTTGAMVAALWLVASPAWLVRHFRRPWLPVAGRILGSWLLAIELLIFTFAVVPMPVNGG